MDRPYGIAQVAFDSYIKATFAAKIAPQRIVQTIGNAPASAGYHAKDGVDEFGHDYTCALDLSVKHPDALSFAQIYALQIQLANHGFTNWFRHTGSFANNVHVHACYAGLPMKRQLRNQTHDWLAGRDGLVDESDDNFWKHNMTDAQANLIRTLFLAHNPATG